MNYGAMLQAYALKETLSSRGFDAHVCDYRQPFVEQAEFFIRLRERSLRGLTSRAIRQVVFRKKRAYFARFREESLNLSARADSDNLYRLLNGAAAVVIGSDQVWNGEITGNDQAFLPELDQSGPRVLAYAASCGSSASFLLDSRQADGLRALLSPILVRDRLTASAVETSASAPTEVVLDPTLLLTKRHWESLIEGKGNPSLNFDYVLAYTVHEVQKTRRFARSLAAGRGSRLVHLHQYDARPTISAVNIYSGAPLQLASLVAGASAVVTSSFHGICLSLAFETPFYIPCSSASPADLDPRWRDLLREAGFTEADYLFNPATGMLGPFSPNPNTTRILAKSRARSLSLLEKQLDEAIGVLGNRDPTC